MRDLEFKLWIDKNKYNKKVVSDITSRLKRIEREFNFIDIDFEYENNDCSYLLGLLKNSGNNEHIKKYKNLSLPLGKCCLSTYSYAIRLYIKYRMESDKNP